MTIHQSHSRQHGSQEVKARIADRIISSMALSTIDVVLDVGSGDGYYTSRFAEYCSKVVAIDEYCENLKSEFYSKANIDAVCEDACRWFREQSVSEITHVFFSNSFHDMVCQGEILSTLAEHLRDGAHIDMIEFHPDTPFGPPRNIRFSREDLKSKVITYGFQEVLYIDLGTHYFVSFEEAIRRR